MSVFLHRFSRPGTSKFDHRLPAIGQRGQTPRPMKLVPVTQRSRVGPVRLARSQRLARGETGERPIDQDGDSM